jgi:hypothetical protein
MKSFFPGRVSGWSSRNLAELFYFWQCWGGNRNTWVRAASLAAKKLLF